MILIKVDPIYIENIAFANIFLRIGSEIEIFVPLNHHQGRLLCLKVQNFGEERTD